MTDQEFTASDVRIVSRDVLFDGFFKVQGVRLHHRKFEGGWTPEIHREVFVRPDATCVLPYDPVTDQVVLLEQFRAGALDRDQSPWLLELVAGLIEPGETPDDVAHREAREEADLTLMSLESICRYLVSPGGSDEMVHLYCALVEAPETGGIHGLDQEHEDIRVHVVSFERAWRLLTEGVINNAASVIALQWLALNRERLRADVGSGDS